MSETSTTGTGGSTGPAASSGATGATGGTGPAATPAAAPAASPAAAPAASDKAAKPAKRGAEGALERVRARKAATAAAPAATPKTTTTPATPEQAPANSGASTPGAAATPATDAPTAGEDGTAKAVAQPDSTVTAPKDWPEAMRDRFAKLPNDEARAVVLSIQKDLQAGFTHATQKISQIEQQHREAIETAKQFRADPKATITALAQRAGVPVFFEPPAAAGEMPEFKDAKEMASWVAKQVADQVRTQQTEAAKQAEAEARNKQATEQVRQGLLKAQKDHPDFETHKAAVFEALAGNPMLEPEQAYRLATYDGLMKLAQDGETAKRELAKLKADVETERKKATAPVKPNGSGTAQADDTHLSPGQRALQRARSKIAGRGVGAR